MRFDVITIFPELFESFSRTSIVGRAVGKGLVEIRVHDLRDYSTSKHRTVDDYPFGGGAGMVMGPEPFFRALDDIEEQVRSGGTEPHNVLLTPAGPLLSQDRVKALTELGQVTLLCGHYKGVDARVESRAHEELSIGDYVLSGGEVPAMVVMDAAIRLLEGAVGTHESVEEDSHYQGLLGYPMYTRPASFRGLEVPEVLLSGHHKKIAAWRREQAEELTRLRRPDLWASYRPEGDAPRRKKSDQEIHEEQDRNATEGDARRDPSTGSREQPVARSRNTT